MEEHTSASVYIPSSSVLRRLLGHAKTAAPRDQATPKVVDHSTATATSQDTTQRTENAPAASAEPAAAAASASPPTYASVIRKSAGGAATTPGGLKRSPDKADASAPSVSPACSPVVTPAPKTPSLARSGGGGGSTKGSHPTAVAHLNLPRSATAALAAPSRHGKDSRDATATAMPDLTTTTTTTASSPPEAATAANSSVGMTPAPHEGTLLPEEDLTFIMATLTWHVDLLVLLLQHAPSPLKVTPRPPAARTASSEVTTTAAAPATAPISGWIDLFQAPPPPSGMSATESASVSARTTRDGESAAARVTGHPPPPASPRAPAHTNSTSSTGGADGQGALPPPTSAVTARSWLDTALFPSLEEAQRYWLTTGASGGNGNGGGGGGRRRNRTFFAPTPVTPRSPTAASSTPAASHTAAAASETSATPTTGSAVVPSSVLTANSGNRVVNGSGSLVRRSAVGTRFRGSVSGAHSPVSTTTVVSGSGGSPAAINVSRLITHTTALAQTSVVPHTPSQDALVSGSHTSATGLPAASRSADSLPGTSLPTDEAPLPSASSVAFPAHALEAGSGGAKDRPSTALAAAAIVGEVVSRYHKSKRRAGRGRQCAKRVLRRYVANFSSMSARASVAYAGESRAVYPDKGGVAEGQEDGAAVDLTSFAGALRDHPSATRRVNVWERGEAGHRLFPRSAAVDAVNTSASETPAGDLVEGCPSTTLADFTARDAPLLAAENREPAIIWPCDFPRAASLDSLSASLTYPFIRPSWLYTHGLGRRTAHERSAGTAVAPAAPRHDRAHVLAQLLASNASLHSMNSDTDTEEEDENRAEELAFAAVESEEEVALANFVPSRRARHRVGGGRSGGCGSARSGGSNDNNSGHGTLRTSASAHTLIWHDSRSPLVKAGKAGRGDVSGMKVAAGKDDEDLPSANVSLSSDGGSRIGVPLDALAPSAARALLERCTHGVSEAATVDGSPSRAEVCRTSVAASIDSHDSAHHGRRRHKRFFYSAQPLLDKQKERRKTERLRKRRERRLRGSGSETSSVGSSNSSGGSALTRSSRSMSSESGGHVTDTSSSGAGGGERHHTGSFSSVSSSSMLSGSEQRVEGGRTRRSGNAHVRTNTSSSSATAHTSTESGHRTPYSRMASGHTPLNGSRTDADVVLPSPPSPRHTLPPPAVASSRSEAPLPARTDTTARHVPTRATRPVVGSGSTTATTATISSGCGPQVKVFGSVKARSQRMGRGNGTAGTKAGTCTATAALKLPERYPAAFFLQKFVRAVLVVLVAQMRWQQPQTTVPALYGRLVAAGVASPESGTASGGAGHAAAASPEAHMLLDAIRQSAASGTHARSAGVDAASSPFRLSAVEYKALCHVRTHLPAFRHMVGTYVMRNTNEVLRRSAQRILTRQVVEETLAELDKATRAPAGAATRTDGGVTATATSVGSNEGVYPTLKDAPASPALPASVLADPVGATDILQQLAHVHTTLSAHEVSELYASAAAASYHGHRLSATLAELVEDVEPLAIHEMYLSGKDAAWQPLLLDLQNTTRVLQCYAEATHPLEHMSGSACPASPPLPASPSSTPPSAVDKTLRSGGSASDAASSAPESVPHHHLLLAALKRFVCGSEAGLVMPAPSVLAAASTTASPAPHEPARGLSRIGTDASSASTSTTMTIATASESVVDVLMATDEVIESQDFLAYLRPLLLSSSELAQLSATSPTATAAVAPAANVADDNEEDCSARRRHGDKRHPEAVRTAGSRRDGGLPHSQSVPVLPSASDDVLGNARRGGQARGGVARGGDSVWSLQGSLDTPGLLDPLIWHAYTYFPDAYPQLHSDGGAAQTDKVSSGGGGDHYMMLYVAALPISGRLVYKWVIPAEDTDRFNLSVFFQSSLFSFLQGGAIPLPTCSDGAAFAQAQARHMYALTDAIAATAAQPGHILFGGGGGGTSPSSVLVHCSAGMHRSCGMVLAHLLWLLFQVHKIMSFRRLRDNPSTTTAPQAPATVTSEAGPPPTSRALEVCMAHVKRCRTIAEPIPTVQFLLEHFARELRVDEVPPFSLSS